MNVREAIILDRECSKVPVEEWRKLKRADRARFLQFHDSWLTAKTLISFPHFLWYGVYWGARKHYRGELFRRMADWMEAWEEKIKFLLVAREHTKTQMAIVWMAWELARDVNTRILIRAYNTPKAQQIGRGLRELLDSPIFRNRYTWVTPKLKRDTRQKEMWGNEGLILDRPDLGVRVPSVEMCGLEKDPTGGHFNCQVCDDYAIKDNETSEILQAELFDKFKEDDNLILAGGRRMICGTIWAKDGFLDSVKNHEKHFADVDYDLFFQPGEVEVFPAPVGGHEVKMEPDRLTFTVADTGLPDALKYHQARLTFENPVEGDTDVVIREVLWSNDHQFKVNRPIDALYEGEPLGFTIGNTRPAAPTRFTLDCVDHVMPPDRADDYPDRSSLYLKRKSQGPYTYGCFPSGTPVLMGDWTEKPMEKIQVGDEVVGWAMLPKTKARLVPARVKHVITRRCPVIRATFESGRTVLCTPDHKWYTGRRGKDVGGTDNHATYLNLGFEKNELKSLISVYDPRRLYHCEDEWAATWLAGFFDGEGDCSGGTIHFSQSRRENPEACQRLRDSLTALEFDYNEIPQGKPSKEVSTFYIRGGRRERMRFLNICNPARRGDVIRSLYKTPSRDFGKASRDPLVSIEEVGEQDVYNIETETGNYVAWGYAAKNCNVLLNPLAKESLIFDAEKIQYISKNEFDGLVRKESGIWYRKCDLATAKDTGSYTAIVTGFVCFKGVFVRRIFWGLPKTDEILLELFRGQIWLSNRYPGAALRHTQMERQAIEKGVGEQLETAQQNPYQYFCLIPRHKDYAEQHLKHLRNLRIRIHMASKGMASKMDRIRDNMDPVLEQQRLYIVDGIEHADRAEKEISEATADKDKGVDLLEVIADLCAEVKAPARPRVEAPQRGLYDEINRKACLEHVVSGLRHRGYV